jgi:hypothetical protein
LLVVLVALVEPQVAQVAVLVAKVEMALQHMVTVVLQAMGHLSLAQQVLLAYQLVAQELQVIRAHVKNMATQVIMQHGFLMAAVAAVAVRSTLPMAEVELVVSQIQHHMVTSQVTQVLKVNQATCI